MGVYVTQAELENHLTEEALIQLTNDDGGSTVDTAVLDDAISDAEDLVDGYVGARYALPFDTVPGVLKRLARTLTIYNLHERRQLAVASVQESYDRAIKRLEHIGNGKLTLGQTTEPEVNAGKKIHSTSNTPVFGRNNFDDAGF